MVIDKTSFAGNGGLTAIGEVTHLLNVWMMNPCEFESHLVRNNTLNTVIRILFLSAKELLIKQLCKQFDDVSQLTRKTLEHYT